MAIKKRNLDRKSSIESLAEELADKPFGQRGVEDTSLKRTSISLPSSLLRKIEDNAIQNKRNNNELKSVSAIVRFCIEKYYNDH